MASLDIREIFGNPDIDPQPLGTRIGDLIHANRITGIDLTTGKLADGIDAQMVQAFDNLRHVVEQAGATLDNVAQVSIFVAQREFMPAINKAWEPIFGNADDRPTYKFMTCDLPGGHLVQLEAWAVAGERRQVLHIPGVFHTNPIPMGVRMGQYVFSSRVLPFDPANNAAPESFDAQVGHVFSNLRNFLAAAGAKPSDLSQIRVFIADRALLPKLAPEWDALFAGATRPQITAVTYGAGTRLQVYIEVIAAL